MPALQPITRTEIAYRYFTAEQVEGLSAHARAVLLAFDDMPWPRFEAHLWHDVPVCYKPLSLCQHDIPRVVAELEARGLIAQWTPAPDADPVKPHPQMCLRRYWPRGRIWVRVGVT